MEGSGGFKGSFSRCVQLVGVRESMQMAPWTTQLKNVDVVGESNL
jgi:hypothetical protein